MNSVKRKKLCLRGFVGPLGDDIPSIFPIVAGVLLFVGTVAYAVDLVNQKNSYLEIRKAGLGLSYLVTEKGVVTQKSFSEKCPIIQRYGTANAVKFIVTIKRYCTKIILGTEASEYASPYYVEKSDAPNKDRDEPGHTWLHCSNVGGDEKELEKLGLTQWPPPTPTAIRAPKNAVLLNYPAAVPCPETSSATNGLGMINVIVWR